VVGELLGDLMNRGLDFAELRLYVLDGGKALHAAVKRSMPVNRRLSSAVKSTSVATCWII
jgi:hypothetical protein